MMQEKPSVAVVVPVYKRQLSQEEQISLRQLQRVLGDYPKIFFAPEGLDFDYGELMQGFRIERFPAVYFSGFLGYSLLMLSVGFYQRFLAYDYILVYQLDAFVFHDALPQFCAMGYDYIGAPVYRFAPCWHAAGVQVGNGGFSLRRTAACLRLVQEQHDLLLHHPLQASFRECEDLFFAYCGGQAEIDFRVPPVATALQFAVQDDVQRVFRRLTAECLPMGCHGWLKGHFAAWQPYLAAAGYALPDGSCAHWCTYRAQHLAAYRHGHEHISLMRLYGLLHRHDLPGCLQLLARWLAAGEADGCWQEQTEDLLQLLCLAQTVADETFQPLVLQALLTALRYALQGDIPERTVERVRYLLPQAPAGTEGTAAWQAMQVALQAQRARCWAARAPVPPQIAPRGPQQIIAITMVKNEQEVIESFVRHTLSFADRLLVCDHQSTDRTRDILARLQQEGLPVEVRTEQRAAYVQAEAMTALLQEAAAWGADIILPLDADEFLLPEAAGSCRTLLEQLSPDKVYRLPWRRYAPQDERDTGFLPARPLWREAGWDEGGKCIVGGAIARHLSLRLVQGNHYAYYYDVQGMRQDIPKVDCALSLAHFFWRSRAQMRTKAAVGWLNIAARFSRDTMRGGEYRQYAQTVRAGGELGWQPFLRGPELCDLRGRVAPQTLRYSEDIQPDVVANLLAAGEALAQEVAAQKAAQAQRSVTSVVPYLGEEEPFRRSLQSVRQQLFARRQLLVPVIAPLPPALQQELAAMPDVQLVVAPDGRGDVFDRLAQAATGDYVSWVLPGETVQPQQLRDMVTSLTLNDPDGRYAALLSDGAPQEAAAVSPYAAVGVTLAQNVRVVTRTALYTLLLQHGKVPVGGLSALLLRRPLLDACHWLRDGFTAEGQPLLLLLYRLMLVGSSAEQFPLLGVLYSDLHGPAARLSLTALAWQQLCWYSLLQQDGGQLDTAVRSQAADQLRRNGITLLTQALAQGEDTAQPVWQAYQQLLQQV